MRILFAILFSGITSVCQAQTAPPIPMGSKLYEFKNGVRFDSAAFMPRRDTTNADPTMLAPGMLQWRPADQSFYGRDSIGWRKFVLSGTLSDYVPISRLINTIPPLDGGGPLSSDLNLSIANAQADGENKGAATFRSDHFDDDGLGAISLQTDGGNPAWITALSWSKITGVPSMVNALNGLSGNLTLTTGAAGSDFGLSPAGSIITINLPSASSTARGALTSADWTTFNNKVATTRTLTVSPGTDISVTGGTQDLSANRTWTINNTATLATTLGRGNSALSDIVLGAVGNSNGYTYLARRLVGGTNYLVGFGASGNTGGGVYISTSNGTSSQDQTIRLVNGETGPIYSPDGGTTGNYIWHAGNHPQGSAFTPTLTGANVLATLTFNSSGHATAVTTRALTASDISAIANGTSPQTANYNITGSGTLGTSLITPTITSASATGSIAIVGGLIGGQQGGQIATYGGNHASRAGDISFHAGTGSGLQTERMTVDGATGQIGVNEPSPGAQLDVRGTSSSTGAAFRVRNSTPAVVFEADNNGDISLFGGVKIIIGTGSPEGVKTAPVGSMYLRTDGGASSTLYIKESGTGNTGWIAK